MEREIFHSIINTNPELAKTLEQISSSLSEAKTDARLRVQFAVERDESRFMTALFGDVDGIHRVCRSTDGKREARQSMRLLAFDKELRLLAEFLCAPGWRGTPKEVIATGDLHFSTAHSFGIMTHREGFKLGEMPPGLPDLNRVPENILISEVLLTVFGEFGIPPP